jgi:hypothetical protein
MVSRMGMLSRMLIPRSVRRATHPVRTVKRAVTPKPVKQIQRAMHPVSNAKYSLERALTTAPRVRSKQPSFTHAGCTVHHRTAEAAAKCRTGRAAPTRRTQTPSPNKQHGPGLAHRQASPAETPPTQPAAPKPTWRRHVPQLTAAVGNAPVTLTHQLADGTLQTVTVQILSVDGWTCLARNQLLHRIDEYDLRRITRVA